MPTYEDFYAYLIDQGVPPEQADAIARGLVQQDMTGWSNNQIIGYVDQFATQAKAVQPSKERVATLQATPQPQYQPANIDPEWLRSTFAAYGVKPDRAKELTQQLSALDVSGWDDNGINKYVQDWANVAKRSEYQQAMAEYVARYDPQTGLSRQDTYAKVEAESQRLAEQQAASYGSVLRERKVTEAAQAQQREQRAWEAAQPSVPSYQTVSEPFVQQRLAAGVYSPAMSRWAEQQIPSIYSAANMPSARQQWWEQKTAYVPSAKHGDEEGAANVELEKKRRAGLTDPWQQFIQSYDFLSKYKALSPKERGYYPSQFKPRARWLG